MATDQYIGQAKQQYDIGYNAKVQAQKNALAETLGSLEGQKTGVNANYDQQVQGQNLNNKLNKNNVSNATLGRGLNNSSIAVSGLAEQDAKNTRLVGTINNARTGALGQIDLNKQLQTQNSNATLGQMAGSREDAIQTLANQLESTAWDKNYKDRTLSMQEQNAQASQAYQQASLAFQKQNAADSMAMQREQYGSTLAFQKEQYANSQKEKQGDPQAVLAQLRTDMNSDDVKGVGDDYAARYANTPGMEYVVKEAKEYSNNWRWYEQQKQQRLQDLKDMANG